MIRFLLFYSDRHLELLMEKTIWGKRKKTKIFFIFDFSIERITFSNLSKNRKSTLSNVFLFSHLGPRGLARQGNLKPKGFDGRQHRLGHRPVERPHAAVVACPALLPRGASRVSVGRSSRNAMRQHTLWAVYHIAYRVHLCRNHRPVADQGRHHADTSTFAHMVFS